VFSRPSSKVLSAMLSHTLSTQSARLLLPSMLSTHSRDKAVPSMVSVVKLVFFSMSLTNLLPMARYYSMGLGGSAGVDGSP
jgi:hypothetical protein